MPKRLVVIPAERFVTFIGRHQRVVTAILMFALLIALGVAVAGWTAARNAEQRVNKLEFDRLADKAAQEQGQKIAQVTTCFNAAKSRPLLTTILRALASREYDPAVRAAFDELISSYSEASTPGIKGEPNEQRCTALAERLGIDPGPYRSPVG